MKPTIGRIVHFHIAGESQPAAAIVTFIHPDKTLKLKVFTASGTEHEPSWVRYAGDDFTPGTWSWPPREPAEKPEPDPELAKLKAYGNALHKGLMALMGVDSMEDVEAALSSVPNTKSPTHRAAMFALHDWNKEVAS